MQKRIRQPVIEVENLTKSFKSLKAVDGLDLTIGAGEFLALLGPNGAGKTTLIEMIEGIQQPDHGSIRLFGMTWDQGQSLIHEKLGIALQETRFTDKLTVFETMELFAGFYGRDKVKAQQVVDVVGLSEKSKTYTQHLSGGQRQKLALGIAIVNDPEVLLLDEPTTGLDPHARQEIWKILDGLKKDGTTMILTTHYMEEAETLCERIVIMNKGKILAQGTLDELLLQHQMQEIIEFELEQGIEEHLLMNIEGSMETIWEDKPVRGCLKVKNLIRALPDFMKLVDEKGLGLLSLQGRKMTLNDLFVQMTGRGLSE